MELRHPEWDTAFCFDSSEADIGVRIWLSSRKPTESFPDGPPAAAQLILDLCRSAVSLDREFEPIPGGYRVIVRELGRRDSHGCSAEK